MGALPRGRHAVEAIGVRSGPLHPPPLHIPTHSPSLPLPSPLHPLPLAPPTPPLTSPQFPLLPSPDVPIGGTRWEDLCGGRERWGEHAGHSGGVRREGRVKTLLFLSVTVTYTGSWAEMPKLKVPRGACGVALL
eukprot:756483-Hanusia_phi.AAC.5